MAGSIALKSSLRTLNWAVYLGCSWTWCIGMFLPVILVSEFGTVAWFVFAIPNVIGAAAMGWTLARPGASEKMMAEHHTACVGFSAVTVAFHLFFLFWLFSIGVMPALFAALAVVGGFSLGFIGRPRVGLDFILGWVVFCVSLAVLGRGLVHPVIGVAHPTEANRALNSMLGLAPICVFGFLLCPYLDVTFHRARRETQPGAGRIAFGLGFGLVFLLMIVLTLLYAGDFALDRGPHQYGSFGTSLLVTWVAMHIAGQTGFTFAAHLRALPKTKFTDLFVWIAAAVLVVLAICAVHPKVNLNGLMIYRFFMSFYGLVFPAYVWICMVPIRGRSPGPSRAALVAVGFSVAIAAPLFWVGFVNEKMLWLIPGVVVVLVSRFLVPQTKPALASPALQGVFDRA